MRMHFSYVMHVVCRKPVWEITSKKAACVKVNTLREQVRGKKHKRIISHSQHFLTKLLDSAEAPGHFMWLRTSFSKGNTEKHHHLQRKDVDGV